MNFNIGENISKLRKEKALTQEQLSEVFGVSVAAVSKWETSTAHPDIELLPKIAAFFDVSVDFLLGCDRSKADTPLQANLKSVSNYKPKFVLMDKLIWTQLADIIELKNLKIICFGVKDSGVKNYLSKNNEVIIPEPKFMLEEMRYENDYMQLVQDKIGNLKDFDEGSFDVVICHHILEYSPEDKRVAIMKEFSRILKNSGILSVIKNNGAGRIMSQVCRNQIDNAVNLLEGEFLSTPFGRVVLYNPEDLVELGDNLKIEKILSLQTFYGLAYAEDRKHDPTWIDKMFDIEMKVADMEPYKSISLFHHVLLRKL
jgi:transcriptional regulator with XRE-family HTH domain